MGKKDPEQIFKEGKQLTCPICSNNNFNTRKTQLNTRGATLLGVNWANKNAQNYICSNSGKTLAPKDGDCCVFCSNADKK